MADSLPSLRGITVLLVEDHQDTLELVAETFRMAGAHVLTAENADRALAVFRARRCAAVLIDVGLPEKDGIWLLDQIRASSRAQTALIAMTGHVLDHDVATRFDAVALKPCDPFDLCRLVIRTVQQRQKSVS